MKGKIIFVLVAGALIVGAFGAYNVFPSYTTPLPGDVQALRVTTVLRELRFAALGSLRSYIWVNDANGNILFAWPMGHESIGWVCLNGNSVSVCNALRAIGNRGNLAAVKDFRYLMDGIAKTGYRPIDATELYKLFPTFVTSIMQSTIAWAQTVIPNIILVPVMPGFFENMPQEIRT